MDVDTNLPAPRGDAPQHDGTRWMITVVAGPDAGGTSALGPGRHLVGRAAGVAVQCDDPSWEPYHALIDVQPDGGARLVPLAGRTPVRVDDCEVPRADGVLLASGCWVELGGSVLGCARGVPAPAAGSAGWCAGRAGEHVQRSPRVVPVWAPTPVVVPAALPVSDAPTGGAAGGLVPSLLGLAGAAAVAVVLRQPMFAVFGAMGALVGIGSWGVQRAIHARGVRRVRAGRRAAEAAALVALARQRDAWVAHHRAVTPTLAWARALTSETTERLWSRRVGDADAAAVSLGWGEVEWTPVVGAAAGGDLGGLRTAVTATRIARLPVRADLLAGRHLALRGPAERTAAMARALLVQQASTGGPADLRIAVVTADPGRWAWVASLPHARLTDGRAAVVDEAGVADADAQLAGHPARRIVVVDGPDLLATRTAPLRRIVHADGGRSIVLVVLVPAGAPVPHLCRSSLTFGSGPVARWLADTTADAVPEPVLVAGLGARGAAAAGARLAGLVDPEDPICTAASMPVEVRLVDLLSPGAPLTPASVATGWLAAGSDPRPLTPIGLTTDGDRLSTVDIDLVRDGPHGLLAGTTGSGKSELLRGLVAGLATRVPPDRLAFVLVDYKGGATFDECVELPHVVGVVTDLDDRLATRALRGLHAELRRRERVLRQHGVPDLTTLRAVAPAVVLPRLVVIVDEFAALTADEPDFVHALVGVAQRGRSLGVHLLLATQRPAGVVSDDIRANTNLRVALRLHDPAEAIDIVGEPSPAALPRGIAGRGVMRLGPDDHVAFQAARTGGDLASVVAAVRGAARSLGIAPPSAPWPEPLPRRLGREAVDSDALGLIDDPDRQCVDQLRWDRASGHLLLVGSTGSGLSSTARLVASQALGEGAHVYVVDAHGSEALAGLTAHPGCGAVVRLHESERLGRLFRHLAGLVRHRTADRGSSPVNCVGSIGTASIEATQFATAGPVTPGPATPGPETLLVVDGLDALRRALDPADAVDTGGAGAVAGAVAGAWHALEHVVAHGAGAQVRVVLTTERAAAVSALLLAHLPHRWVFHLADPHDASLVGVRPSAVPAAVPGRLVVAACGREAQVTIVGDETPTQARVPADPAPPIECLPESVPPALVPRGTRADAFTVQLPLGLRYSDGGIAAVRVSAGEHLLVAGPSRSGRTTVLCAVARAWRGAHPTGAVDLVCGRPWSAVALDELGAVVLDGPAAFDAAVGMSTDRPHLLLADDADAADDWVAAAVGGLLAARRTDVLVVAAGLPDALRSAYGHWTGVVRRSRLGVLTAACADLDGELLGAVLPRRPPLPPRPGLCWIVDRGVVELVQVAGGPDGEVQVPVGSSRWPSASSMATRRFGATVR
jgi:S-DNA-T family DNA segregation ATPase FtsK/SpoIIIE